MQKVSNEYKISMKNSLRERSYMMISFGLFNQEAQTNAEVKSGETTYFSDPQDIFSKSDVYDYATLEENFTRVDGEMLFLPKEKEGNIYYNNGLVSKDVVGEDGYVLLIHLNMPADDIKGLTVDFGNVFPTDFDIETGNGKIVHITDNTETVFTTQDVFENTDYFKFTFYKMSSPNCRLRIRLIQFGYGLVFYNDKIYDSTLETYISPICESVPQFDFSVTLNNIDKYFNVDNPNSAINFIETGQQMEVWYGYKVSSKIEWIKGAKLLCSEWESDDNSATIKCQDIYRNMDNEYFKGMYRSEGISYYDLAALVFEDAGIEEYYIDPYLKKVKTTNPLPRVKHKEALQIISNACRCVLTLDRNGKPHIESSFKPGYVITSNGETAYSHLQNIKESEPKQEYATLSCNYTTVDAEMFFLPRDVSAANLYTGYISAEISDENGMFAHNPTISITQESACMYYGVRLIFGQSLPCKIIFRTYNAGQLVESYNVTEGIVKDFVVQHEFFDFDVMEIEFAGTKDPYNRIVLNYFSFGNMTDFKLERQDMTSSPKSIKQELVKEIRVPYYAYQPEAAEEVFVNEEIDATENEVETFFLDNPIYDCNAVFGESEENVEIVSVGTYYVTVKFRTTGKYTLSISGHRYSIVTRYAVKELNERGKNITWNNPLVSDADTAQKLAEWLGEYYSAGVEYEYDTRGNPELDVGDIIFQDNDYRTNMKVSLYRSTLKFGGSLSGKVTTRRINE